MNEIYRNNMKNRESDKEAPRNSSLERENIVRRQGSSEERNCGGKPMLSETDSSCCFGIPSFLPLDELLASRVLSRFDRVEEGQSLFLKVLFALFRKGHLALELTDGGIEWASQELAIADKEGFSQLLSQAAKHSFTDRKGVEWVICHAPFYYLQKNAEQQRQIATSLHRLLKAPLPSSSSLPEMDPVLNEQQRQAISTALNSPLSILTGGPGTGKSFTAAHLALALQRASIIVTAPTGKATAHLQQGLQKQLGPSYQIRAATLHALLRKDQQLKADLILVDESSMLDVSLFVKLLSSIPPSTRTVLIGDPDQLPPVEAGSLFADLVESDKLPVTRLTHCLRCESQGVLDVALAISQGKDSQALKTLQTLDAWIDLEEQETGEIEPLLQEHFSQKFSPALSDAEYRSFTKERLLEKKLSRFAILSCMRQGPLGVEAINRFYLRYFFEKAPLSSWLIIPIIVTANHYEWELYNGDQGLLIHKKSPTSSLKAIQENSTLLFLDRQGGVKEMPSYAPLSYAYNYALSVHKSQGSEYEQVLVLAPKGSEVFGREVLYTAVTRAKKEIFIASTKELLSKTIQKTSRKRSGIQNFLQ